MERTERLLDLVALLLDAKGPVTWNQIREAFPEDYKDGSEEATERKFERDKAELLELGIPLTYFHSDDEHQHGYVIDREAYYLPKLDLKPEELAVLYTAGSAALSSGAFPASADLTHALRKIGFSAGPRGPAPKVRLSLQAPMHSARLTEHLEQLWTAVSNRKYVELDYYSPRKQEVTHRKISPYGLALRLGVWNLVGHCHLRGDVRTFHVHRIKSLTVNPKNPRSADYEVPADFALDRYVARHSWEHRFHPPVEVSIELRGALVGLGANLFPGAKHVSQGQVHVTATDLESLLRFVMSLGSEAVVTSPPDAVARYQKMAETILMRHSASKGDLNARA